MMNYIYQTQTSWDAALFALNDTYLVNEYILLFLMQYK